MSWRRFFQRSRRDDEFAREVQSYIEIETDENIARGLSPADARAAALRKFGNTTRMREDVHLMNTIGPIDAIWQDVRYAARLLRRDKGFAIAAIVSLALGIGANTAIFQLLDAIRLRSLPVDRPEEIVEVRMPPGSSRRGSFNGRRPMWTYPQVEEIRRHQQAFSALAAWSSRRFNTAPGGEVRFVEGLFVSGDFFPSLGVSAAIGRLFTPEDDRRGCAPAAVISHAHWQQSFGGSASVLGQTVLLDGVPFPIVGVTEPRFFGVEVGRQYDVAVPLCADEAFPLSASGAFPAQLPRRDRRDVWWLALFGRLKPDWSVERATEHLGQLSAPIFAATLPANYQAEDAKNYLAFRMIAQASPGGISGLRADFGQPLVLLLAISGLVLLIACANLANLLLARATTREREIAARLALGASRPRLIRQLLVESLLLAAVGAVAGGFIGQALSNTLVAVLATGYVSLFVDLASDARLFAFTAGVAALACMLFGLMPALRATAIAPGAALKAGGRGMTTSRRAFMVRRTLVVSQVALSLVLVLAAVLFTRTLYNLLTADPGFKYQNIVAVVLSQLPQHEPGPGAQAARRELFDRLASLPEVAEVAIVDVVPMSGSLWNESVRVEGVPGVRPETGIANFNRVGPGYLRMLGIPLLAGRDFDGRDSLTTPDVAIVSEGFVRKFVPDGQPLGRTIHVQGDAGMPERVYEIVGVARDTKYGELREEIQPLAYVSSFQEVDPGTAAQLIMRPRGSREAMTAAVLRAAHAVSPHAFVQFTVVEESIRSSFVREQLMAALSAAFGALAGLLAAVGLYGVMSYNVARRANEIGVRLALGAERRDVLRLVLSDAAKLVVLGVIAGTLLGAYASRWAETLLYGLEPWDPVTFVVAPAILLAVGLLAGYVPAHRASRVDPVTALRDE